MCKFTKTCRYGEAVDYSEENVTNVLCIGLAESCLTGTAFLDKT